MTTLTYRAKMFKGTGTAYAGALVDLPIVGVGRTREEAMQLTETAMIAHLGRLLALGKPFPKPYRGEIEDDYFAIQIESASIQPYDPFNELANPEKSPWYARLDPFRQK